MDRLNKAHYHIEKHGKHVDMIIDVDMPLGVFHDILMEIKGWCVNKMIEVQRQEENMAKEKISEEGLKEDGENS